MVLFQKEGQYPPQGVLDSEDKLASVVCPEHGRNVLFYMFEDV